MKKIIFAIVITFCAIPLKAQLQWQVLGPMPYPVSGGQVVYDINSQSNKIYIFGGYSDSLQSAVDWIQEYDVVKNSWQIVGHMLQPRDQFVADIWKNSVMYFGGTTDASTDKNAIEAWDYRIVSNLASVYDRNKNFGRSFSTGHIVGDNFYIIGGDPLNPNDTLAYVSAYNFNTKQNGFSFKYPTSTTISQRMTFIVGDNIYILGGVINGVINSIQRFNIQEQKLYDLQESLLEPRAAGAAVYNPISQKAFIIGGYNERASAMNTVEQIEILPNGTLKITQSVPLTYARTNLMAVAYKNGFVAVFGGRTDRGHSGKVVSYVELLVDKTSEVNHENKLPAEFKLFQNYPNPFNPTTQITFQLASKSDVSLDIFSVLGQHIKTLEKGMFEPGTYRIFWNGQDEFNDLVPSGIYFLQLRSGNFIQTKKMVMLK